MSALHSNKIITEKKSETADDAGRKPVSSVIPLFAGFTREEFEDFTKMMTVHTLQPGHTIMRQGDAGKSVYIIASGGVKVWVATPTGERLDLAVLNPNDFFGEMSFLTGKPRTANVETSEESVVLEVTEEQLGELIARRPRMRQVLQQYSDARVKGTTAKIQSAKKTDVDEQPAATAASPEKKPDAVNSVEKAKLTDAIQKQLGKGNWKAAIEDMEKLFALDPDPIVRVRIGDARQKLNQKGEAVAEYVRAADLYAEKGVVVKALAQYKLALRLDPVNAQAQQRIEALHSNRTVKENRAASVDKEAPKHTGNVMPLFAGFSQEEFNAFTQVMNVHPLPEGVTIVEQNDNGKSVYLIASGSVKIFTTLLSGERVDLAVLRSGDFFGEIAFLTGKPRSATVETAEDSVILEITEDKLQEITSQRPNLREALQKFSDLRSKGTSDKIMESNK
jgi:CRP-like cAMP-binding protein